MMVFFRAVVFIVMIMCAATVTAGDFPRQMSYQAILTDDMGDPLSQNGLSVRYFLYADSTGGSFLWAEVTQIDIVDGRLNHYLGSSCPVCGIPDSIFFNQDMLWLEIMIDGEAMEPRTKLSAYPYAYRVASIDKTTGGTVTGEISLQSTTGGNALEVLNTGSGRAGYFQIGNVGNSESALIATTNGSGPALTAFTDGGGMAGVFAGGNVDIQDNGFMTKFRFNPVGAPFGGGYLSVYNSAGLERAAINGDWFGAGYFRLNNAAGTAAFEADGATGHVAVHDPVGAGEVNLYTGSTYGGLLTANTPYGVQTVELRASQTGTDGAHMVLRNSSGTAAIILDASDVGGDGRVTTEVLEITGGSDLSEQFNIKTAAGGTTPLPGMVVSIDIEQIGQLKVSESAYDPTVAGIISGANGIKPGMLMGQHGTITDGDFAVALTGRVYCLVDASFGSVQPGDMLTTSLTAGHAMLASDISRAPGTIIGKAMSSLNSGQGYVLVLVSLQ